MRADDPRDQNTFWFGADLVIEIVCPSETGFLQSASCVIYLKLASSASGVIVVATNG
jgi:hypothetical protein